MADEERVTDIVTPHPHDILSGRGNLANRHPGNENFRALVKSYKKEYVACSKSQKSMYAKIIYDRICSMDPPGRFLKQDPVTKLWSSIGKKKSIDKTRQALREGAPELLKGLKAGEQDEAPTCFSSEQAHVIDDVCSLNDFKDTNPFTSNQSQRRPRHLRFLSDTSIDSLFSMGSCNMTEQMNYLGGGAIHENFYNASPSETTKNTSSQVSEGTCVNNQVYPETELSAMLRALQMQMIQRHMNEWQQFSNTRGSLQNTGHSDAQLQLQAINLQLQLQNTWIQAFQQVGNQANQQQSFNAGNTQNGISHFNNGIPSLNTTNETTSNASNVHMAQITSPSLPHAQQQITTGSSLGNGQDFSAWLAALQNNANGIDANHSNASAANIGANESLASNNFYQQLHSQLAHQHMQVTFAPQDPQIPTKMNCSTTTPLLKRNNDQDSHEDATKRLARAKSA